MGSVCVCVAKGGGGGQCTYVCVCVSKSLQFFFLLCVPEMTENLLIVSKLQCTLVFIDVDIMVN